MKYSLAESLTRRRYYVLAWCSATLLLVIAVLLVFLWRSQSVRIFSVQSASMEPYIQVGDAVVVRSLEGVAVSPGDVVTYQDSNNPQLFITHRVVSIDESRGMVIAKGDANPTNDAPVHNSLIVGEVSAVAPKIGYAIDLLRTPLGLLIGIYIPALIVLAAEMRRLILYYARSPYHVRHIPRKS